MTVKDVDTGIDYKCVVNIEQRGSIIFLKSLEKNLVCAYLNDELVFRCEKVILTNPSPELQIYNCDAEEEHIT